MQKHRVQGMRPGAAARTALIALAALACGVCGGGSQPARPTAPSVPVATPIPAATPAPEPPVSQSCARIGDGSATHACREEAADFQIDVTQAVATLQGERPDIFDSNNQNLVRNVGAYYVGLIRILDRKSICARFDGEELNVKTSNDYNEQYKVLTSANRTNRKYIGTCTPAAALGAPRALPAPPPGCTLPASREIACGKPESQLYDTVAGVLDSLLTNRPELFDLNDTAPGTGWPRVRDLNAYYATLIETLARQGLCAISDGEEIQVKKTNEFTEHFDVNYSDKYIRTGPGIYRGACYPAAF